MSLRIELHPPKGNEQRFIVSVANNGAEIYRDKVDPHSSFERSRFIDGLAKRIALTTEHRALVDKQIVDATPIAKPEGASHVTRVSMQRAVKQRIEQYRQGPPDRIELGIPALDKRLGGGISYGNLVVIAALSSHGKTAMALQAADWITTAQKMPVVFISIEMAACELADRKIAFASSVPRENWHQAVERLEQDTKMHFTDSATCTVVEGLSSLDEISDEIERAFKAGVRVAFIDYAQLIDADGRDDTNATMRRVSATFKRLAKDYNAIVVALAQLNKRVEARVPMVPRLTDIEYGSKLGHDSDVALFLLWPYRVDSKKPANEYQIFIEKNRNGQSKLAVACRFNPPRQMISEERRTAHDFDEHSDSGDMFDDRKDLR